MPRKVVENGASRLRHSQHSRMQPHRRHHSVRAHKLAWDMAVHACARKCTHARTPRTHATQRNETQRNTTQHNATQRTAPMRERLSSCRNVSTASAEHAPPCSSADEWCERSVDSRSCRPMYRPDAQRGLQSVLTICAVCDGPHALTIHADCELGRTRAVDHGLGLCRRPTLRSSICICCSCCML